MHATRFVQQHERWALAAAFVLVHAIVIMLGIKEGLAFYDLEVYQRWLGSAHDLGSLPAIGSDWVYPVVALVPMLLASLGGGGVGFVAMWLVVVVALHAAVLVALWQFRVVGYSLAWGWLLALALLGPIALGRIDAVTAALGLVGVAVIGRHPAIASALFTVGVWVKVWPAALLAALVIADRRRKVIAITAVIVSTVIVVLQTVLGGGRHVLGFAGVQVERGLQIEAPLAVFHMWQGAFGVGGATIHHDREIGTWQVGGTGADSLASASTPLMLVIVVAAVLLAAIAVRRLGSDARIAPVLATVVVSGLLLTNKVGSPQFTIWLFVPAAWLCITWLGRHLVVPVVSILVCAFSTHVVVWGYRFILEVSPWMVGVLTVRDVSIACVCAWGFLQLGRLGRRPAAAEKAGSSADRRLTAHV